ncbi:MAG TPA: amidohydrolase [Acidimicrobiia bacterium]|nr:amidohydrolase [Acidimicrobiia bacterium]
MTRYRVDHLLTMAEGPGLHSPGVVDVQEGKVQWSGPADLAPVQEGPSVSLRGLLIPGLVNTHAHTPMVLLRGAGEGLPVSRWLTEVMWPREGRLTSADVEAAMTLGAGELLANGITTSHEMYFLADGVARAAAGAGLRCVVTPPVLVAADLARFGTWEEQVEEMVALAERWQGHPLVTVGFGPHSAYALSEETLLRVAELSASHGMHIQIHLDEQAGEGDEVRQRTGLSVTAYLDQLGIFATRAVAAHAVWLSPSDIEILAARPVGVAHCPCSNAKHASGMAPVVELRRAGIPVGLGTDGPASHDRLDLFEEMRWALRIARLRAGDAGAMGPLDVLAMATVEGASVLGRDDIGRLASGCRADMVLIDTDPLMPVVDEGDLLTHLVYSGSPSLVRDVWVEGERVVAGGQPLNIDMTDARRDVTGRARRLAQAT